MSLYGDKFKIGGLSCGLVLRGGANGEYRVVFEREYASLEEIEALNWDPPTIEGECILPAGYGFTVKDIQYSASTRSYHVVLQVGTQYLGDVTGYQAQVTELQGPSRSRRAPFRPSRILSQKRTAPSPSRKRPSRPRRPPLTARRPPSRSWRPRAPPRRSRPTCRPPMRKE